jgi:hypothetical protein
MLMNAQTPAHDREAEILRSVRALPERRFAMPAVQRQAYFSHMADARTADGVSPKRRRNVRLK